MSECHGVLYLYGGFNGTAWFDDFWTLDLTTAITKKEVMENQGKGREMGRK
jgi:hypothetical protein